MKTAIRNFGTVFTMLFIALSISFFTLANDTTGNGNNKDSNDKVELRFIGNIQDHPVYQVSLNGSEQEEYVISFRETDGTVVYTDVVKGNFSQRYMLRSGDAGGEKTLRMEIKAKSSGKTRVYLIKKTENVVEENVIVQVQ